MTQAEARNLFGGMDMSWDPTTAMRDAMVDQFEKLQRVMNAVDVNDKDAPEMQRRLQAQIDDLQRRIGGIDDSKSRSVGEKTPAPTTQAKSTETESNITGQKDEEVLAKVVEVQKQLQAEQRDLREVLVTMQREQMVQRELLQKIMLVVGSTFPTA